MHAQMTPRGGPIPAPAPAGADSGAGPGKKSSYIFTYMFSMLISYLFCCALSYFRSYALTYNISCYISYMFPCVSGLSALPAAGGNRQGLPAPLSFYVKKSAAGSGGQCAERPQALRVARYSRFFSCS